jgi:hypothetical protein
MVAPSIPWVRRYSIRLSDGVGIATANDAMSLDPSDPEAPRQVVPFGNPDADLRRPYDLRLSPNLGGEQLEIVIEKTEGFSIVQLREGYILGAQSAFEHAREVGSRMSFRPRRRRINSEALIDVFQIVCFRRRHSRNGGAAA